jgi:hypothetical protein
MEAVAVAAVTDGRSQDIDGRAARRPRVRKRTRGRFAAELLFCGAALLVAACSVQPRASGAAASANHGEGGSGGGGGMDR